MLLSTLGVLGCDVSESGPLGPDDRLEEEEFLLRLPVSSLIWNEKGDSGGQKHRTKDPSSCRTAFRTNHPIHPLREMAAYRQRKSQARKHCIKHATDWGHIFYQLKAFALLVEKNPTHSSIQVSQAAGLHTCTIKICSVAISKG